jgi:hypothetical protein
MVIPVYRTSVLIFFGEARIYLGLVLLGVYIITILLTDPYTRVRDETMQLTVQMELYLLLLAAHLLDNNPESETLMDLVLSLVLLAVTLGAVLLFLYYAVLHVRQIYRQEARIKHLKANVELALASTAETPRSTAI